MNMKVEEADMLEGNDLIQACFAFVVELKNRYKDDTAPRECPKWLAPIDSSSPGSA